MDIRTMPAGRAMDALVAKEVLKWDVRIQGNDDPWVRHPIAGPFADCGCPSHVVGEYAPHFSTDIAAAWLVVEKVRITAINRWLTCWSATVDGGEGDSYTANGDTASLAICRAALLAVGVTETVEV